MTVTILTDKDAERVYEFINQESLDMFVRDELPEGWRVKE